MMRRLAILVFVVASAAVAARLGARQVPEADALRGTTPPANGIWVDSLDQSKIQAERELRWSA